MLKKVTQLPGRIFSLKVFNTNLETSEKAILSALTFAEENQIKLLNLPFGRRNLRSFQIDEKIRQMNELGFIFIVANGNEGQSYGSINYPAESIFVMSVGSLDFNQNQVEKFSSRGPSLSNISQGLGLIKPNLILFGNKILGTDLGGKCVAQQGTSISSTIFTALVFFLFQKRSDLLNFGSLSWLIKKSTQLIENVSLFAQGSGKLEIQSFMNFFEYRANEGESFDEEKVFIFSPIIDLRQENKYFNPFNQQPFYYSKEMLTLNLQIFKNNKNPVKLKQFEYQVSPSEFQEFFQIKLILESNFVFTGKLNVILKIIKNFPVSSIIDIDFAVLFQSDLNSLLKTQFQVKLNAVPRPKKEKLVLFDFFHNKIHPFDGQITSDVNGTKITYDDQGDHMFTNFYKVYQKMID